MRLSLGCRCFVFYDQYNLGQMLLQPMLQVIFTFCIGIINKYYNVKLGNISKNSVCCSWITGIWQRASKSIWHSAWRRDLLRMFSAKNHNHRPCRWFAQAPLGPITSRTYRFIESSFYCMMRPTAIEMAAWRILLFVSPWLSVFLNHTLSPAFQTCSSLRSDIFSGHS